jgi:hypothetical protein
MTLANMETDINKVFEIGVMKTGTTSLGQAFGILGYKPRGWDSETAIKYKESGGDCEILYEVINRYDAFHDGPWHDYDFTKLDENFPNSKFILLDRGDASWIRSLELHTNKQYQTAKDIYQRTDTPVSALDFWDRGWANPEKFKLERIAWKRQKYNNIKSYFKHRPSDLLTFDISNGWEELCSFLKKEVPNQKFPFANVTTLV